MPQRGDIDYDLIRSAARQGAGAQFQMFAGSPPVNGHIAIYDVNGNVTDGGPPVASYVLPPATSGILGGVKIGANVSVAADGTISVAPPGSGGQNQTPWLSNIDGAGYTLYSAGRIGVNVTSPQTQLEIAGGLLIDSTAAYTTPATGTGIWMYCDNTGYSTIASRNFTGAVYTDLELDGQDLYMYALGAGANGGTVLLDALGARAAINVQASDNAGGAASINFNVNGVSGAPGGSIRMNQQGTSISNSSTHTTPAYPLHVDGDCNVSGVYRVNGVPLALGQNQTPWLSDIQGANYRLHHCAGIGIGVTSVNSAGVQVYGNFGETGFNHINTSSTGFAGFRADSDAVSVQLLANGTAESVLPSTASLITIGAYPLVFGANSAEAMRITSGGNVGIGTTSPQQVLDVNGRIQSSGSLAALLTQDRTNQTSGNPWAIYSTSAILRINAPGLGDVVSITDNALVGIGNGYIPTATLDVNGYVRSVSANYTPTSGAGTEITFDSGGHIGYIQAYDRGANAFLTLKVQGNPIELLGGNVGIGTSSPQYALDVAGNSRLTLTGNGSNASYWAYASGTLTLTTGWQNVPGCSFTVNQNGRYLVIISLEFVGGGTNDVNQLLQGVVLVNGGLYFSTFAVAQSLSGEVMPASQSYVMTASPGQVLSLGAMKIGGSGGSAVYPAGTSISAVYLGT